jgi:tRNA 5-methylaminomethyl-2-thiouridine biosynthesis bifunctional protein
VLQIAKDARDEARMAATVRALGFPAGYVEFLPRGPAGDRAGVEVTAGGWWFPDGGWMQPVSLVNAQLAVAGGRMRIVRHFGAGVHALTRIGDRWEARAPDGKLIASAPVAVLANSHHAARLVPLGTELKRVRGQITLLPEDSMPRVRVALAGAGHLVPLGNGAAAAGATYDYEDEGAAPSAEGHAGNLVRVERLLAEGASHLDPARLAGAVGFRCVSPDRLPLIGALPDIHASPRDSRALPRLPGLYGALAYASRGLTWAALGAELIASLVDGEPLPLEGDLIDAVDPGRFALRRARRGRS